MSRVAARWLPQLALVLALVLALGTGCASDPAGEADRIPATSAPTVTAPTPLRERCASSIPAAAPLAEAELTGPHDVVLRAAVFEAPESRVGLVLLHQISGGLCGWGDFATAAAAEGVSSVAFDMCGFEDSTCPDGMDNDAALQVRLAARHAREQWGVDRVVVVGASMGGSQAVRAVAGGAPVDAWVDVSGPSAWGGDWLLDLAGSVERPGLVVFTRTDGTSEYAAARALARRTSAGFVDGGSGHGWDLLTTVGGRITPVGRQVLSFATGE